MSSARRVRVGAPNPTVWIVSQGNLIIGTWGKEATAISQVNEVVAQLKKERVTKRIVFSVRGMLLNSDETVSLNTHIYCVVDA